MVDLFPRAKWLRYSNGIWIPDKLVWFPNGQLALSMYCGLKTGPVFVWLKTRWPILPFVNRTQTVSGKWLGMLDCTVFRWWLYMWSCPRLNIKLSQQGRNQLPDIWSMQAFGYLTSLFRKKFYFLKMKQSRLLAILNSILFFNGSSIGMSVIWMFTIQSMS
jgi:hypothetical protein